ncbi:MAG: ATP-binding cassette domain-containing protein [Elainellaceae cyanobacterium]
MTNPDNPFLAFDHVGLDATVGLGQILEDISFEIQRGDRLALVGPSGAGKTSLLRLINRLHDPSRGKIYLAGQDIRHESPLALRQKATLVMQESSLLDAPVRDALTYPLKLRRLSESVIEERLQTWMQRMSIPSEWLDRTELNLSVGQRQWVAIARALMIEPEVLLLDEPTSALDEGRGQLLVRLLKTWSEAQHVTIIMANHQLHHAQSWCTRVLVLDGGRIYLDQSQHQADWSMIKEHIVQSELKNADEWDEEDEPFKTSGIT